MVAIAFLTTVLLAGAVTAVVVVPSSPNRHAPATTRPAPGSRDPLAGRELPETGLAVLTDVRGGGPQHEPSSFEIALLDDSGTVLAHLGRRAVANDVLNLAPRQLVATDTGVRIEHRPLAAAGVGAPAGCTVTGARSALRVAVCGVRSGDQLLGDRIVVDRGNGWEDLIAKPPVPAGIINGGHWVFADPSGDGRWVLAQWSGECEAQHALLISVADRAVYAVTGEAGPGWAGTPESTGLGWTGNGKAIIGLMSAECGATAHDVPGVYLVSPLDRSRSLLVPLPSRPAGVLRWTTVDDQRTRSARAISEPFWDQIVAADGGLWAFENHLASAPPEPPRLARLDPTTGRVLTEVRDDAVPTQWLAVEAEGVLWTGSRPDRVGMGTVVVFDARTLAALGSIPIADGPVAISRGRTSLWVAGDHALYRVDPTTRTVVATIDMPGAPISGIAVDPGGTRLYVEQFSERQEVSLSVRSARSGAVLVAPRVVDAGPGPGQIAATLDGVWLAQPTGMLGHVQQYSTDLVVGAARIEGSNGISVRTDAGVVLVNGVTDDPALTCLDRKSGRFTDMIAGSQIRVLPAFTSDGTRLYLAPRGGGIEVRKLPPACKQ